MIMPLSERDPNVSGRSSRASNISSGSRGIRMQQSNGAQAENIAPGVMSMMKTTTDFGDIDTLPPRPQRPAIAHRQYTRPVSAATSRLSTTSIHSAKSSNHSLHYARLSDSPSRRERSNHGQSNEMLADDLASTRSEMTGSRRSMRPPSSIVNGGSRSLSLTSATLTPHHLAMARSLGSLRGQDMPQRPRSPYRYPTRLRRPGYRPASPALSDAPISQSRPLYLAPGSKLRPAQPAVRPLQVQQKQSYQQSWNPAAYAAPYYQERDLDLIPRPLRRRPSAVESNRDGSIETTDSYVTANSTSTMPTPAYSTTATPTAARTITTSRHPFADATLAKPTLANSSQPRSPVQPRYYDYTEQSNDIDKRISQIYEETATTPIPAGFVNRIRALLEEKANAELEQHIRLTQAARNSLLAAMEAPDIPELPATPVEVPKRITREMILSAISSDQDSTGNRTSTIGPGDATGYVPTQLREVAQVTSTDTAPDANRFSIVSHASTTKSNETDTAEMMNRALQYNNAASSTSPPAESKSDGPINIKPQLSSESSDFPIAMPTPIRRPSISALESNSRLIRPQTTVMGSKSIKEAQPAHFSLPLRRPKSSDSNSGIVEGPKLTIDCIDPTLITLPKPSDKERSEVTPTTDPSSPPSIAPSIIIETTVTQTVSPLSTTNELTTNYQGPISPLLPAQPPQARLSQARHSLEKTGISNASRLSNVWEFADVLSALSPANERLGESSRPVSVENTTTALRFSTFMPERAISNPLPDVKEESSVEGSTGDFRLSNFRFPVPAALDRGATSEKARELSEPPPAIVRESVFKNDPLRETRNIPSFNFSQVDLFSKLSKVMSQRHGSSFDCFSYLLNNPDGDAQADQAADESTRDKYRSLFCSLDDSEHHYESITGPIMPEKPRSLPSPPVEVQHPRSAMYPTLRPISPTEVIAEVDEISVPSLAGLTHRLSELLPSFKRYFHENTYVEDVVESSITAIHTLSRGISPAPGERPIRASKVGNGIMIEQIEPGSSENLPFTPGPTIVTTDQFKVPIGSGETRTMSKKTPLAELEAPAPALLRARAMLAEDNNGHSTSPEAALINGQTVHTGSPTAAPWKLDNNFP